MENAEVDSIGQGRVWCGSDAIPIGLVDINGGLQKSIEVAAQMANIDEYSVKELPKQLEPLQQLMSEVMGDYETKMMERQMGAYYEEWKTFQSLKNQSGMLTKMPYDFTIN